MALRLERTRFGLSARSVSSWVIREEIWFSCTLILGQKGEYPTDANSPLVRDHSVQNTAKVGCDD